MFHTKKGFFWKNWSKIPLKICGKVFEIFEHIAERFSRFWKQEMYKNDAQEIFCPNVYMLYVHGKSFPPFLLRQIPSISFGHDM